MRKISNLVLVLVLTVGCGTTLPEVDTTLPRSVDLSEQMRVPNALAIDPCKTESAHITRRVGSPIVVNGVRYRCF